MDNALVDLGNELTHLGILHPGLGQARDGLGYDHIGTRVELSLFFFPSSEHNASWFVPESGIVGVLSEQTSG
jgi:hypothetical protein